jgi:hypothetical protein
VWLHIDFFKHVNQSKDDDSHQLFLVGLKHFHASWFRLISLKQNNGLRIPFQMNFNFIKIWNKLLYVHCRAVARSECPGSNVFKNPITITRIFPHWKDLTIFIYFFQYVSERNLNYFNFWQFLIFHSKMCNWGAE